MSTPTLTQPAFEIREGRGGPDGSRYRVLDGVVDGQAVVTAMESLPAPEVGPWLLVTYPDVALTFGVTTPSPMRARDADQAREWVAFISALHAAARHPGDML